MSDEHARISPTAYHVAYVRGRTEIPYARDIARISRAAEQTRAFFQRPYFSVDLTRLEKMKVFMELRFWATYEAIRATGIYNILELGSGMSPLGLCMSEDERYRYVESDLEEMIKKKEDVVGSMIAQRKNLTLVRLHALSGADTQAACRRFFTYEPVCIAHEGLLQYLLPHERTTLARNIHTILRERGGVWVTPDIVLKEHVLHAASSTDYARSMYRAYCEGTGRNTARIGFESYDEALRWFGEHGFSVESHAQHELSPTTVSSYDLSSRTYLKQQYVWTMRIQ